MEVDLIDKTKKRQEIKGIIQKEIEMNTKMLMIDRYCLIWLSKLLYSISLYLME